MALYSSCFSPHLTSSLKNDRMALHVGPNPNVGLNRKSNFALKTTSFALLRPCNPSRTTTLRNEWSFVVGSRIIVKRNVTTTFINPRKRSTTHASWLANPQIANNVFTLGTIAVLPFYTLMVVAPKADLTKKCMQSSVPYVVLGVLYAYLLYLSWTPETIKLMFASKYLLPELSGMAKMFSSEMTLASAWIHLLVIDLFAARQVFHDGLENQIETRHSVSLCLLFCPIGIVAHAITKALTKQT